MLHVWLIPAIAVLGVVIVVLYLVLKVWGGDGVRTDGRTLVDTPEDEEPLDKEP